MNKENLENGDTIETTEQTKKSKKHLWLIPLFVVLVLLAGTYVGGITYASQKFLPNTSIRGFDVSGMTCEEANELFESEELIITVDQKAYKDTAKITETIDLAEIAGAKVEYDTSFAMEAQDKYRWFMSFFQPTVFEEVHAKGSFDINQLKLAIRKLYSQNNKTAVLPKDAYLKIDGKKITIVPDDEGSVVDRDIAVERILAAAEALVNGEGEQTVDLSDACKEPKSKADDPELIAKKNALEKVLGRSITIYPTSYREIKIEGEDILDFFDLKGSKMSVNEEKLDAYAADLASNYYVNRYEYLLYDDLLQKLKAALTSDKKDSVIEAGWYINYPTPKSGGKGSASFVEISIGQQYLWYYENGQLILSTPIVTGQQGEHDTPTGYFTVTDKATKTRLVGKDYDVEVNYWMGIDYVGYYGMHDATWRGSFGGDIYTYDGSHGCINLPYGIAESLYSMVKVGSTEVYIY